MLEHLAEQEILLFLVKMSLASLVKFFFNRMLCSSPSFFHRVSVLSIACTKELFLSFVIPTADWSVRVCVCTHVPQHTQKWKKQPLTYVSPCLFIFFFPWVYGLLVWYTCQHSQTRITTTHAPSLSLPLHRKREGARERVWQASG